MNHPDPPPEYNSWDEVWTEAVRARQQLAHAESDLAQARETVHVLLAAENRTLHCAFCGQGYPEGTPESKHERLAAHIRECRSHPLAPALAALKDLALLHRRIAGIAERAHRRVLSGQGRGSEVNEKIAELARHGVRIGTENGVEFSPLRDEDG